MGLTPDFGYSFACHICLVERSFYEEERIMTKGWGIGAQLLIIGGLVTGLFCASAVQGQVIHPDQIIGTPSQQRESPPEGGFMPNEPTAGDLEKGFDRQLMVPDTGSSGGMDMNLLKTPDASDAENARESDSRSAVSF
jgi:hypothetical protein